LGGERESEVETEKGRAFFPGSLIRGERGEGAARPSTRGKMGKLYEHYPSSSLENKKAGGLPFLLEETPTDSQIRSIVAENRQSKGYFRNPEKSNTAPRKGKRPHQRLERTSCWGVKRGCQHLVDQKKGKTGNRW